MYNIRSLTKDDMQCETETALSKTTYKLADGRLVNDYWLIHYLVEIGISMTREFYKENFKLNISMVNVRLTIEGINSTFKECKSLVVFYFKLVDKKPEKLVGPHMRNRPSTILQSVLLYSDGLFWNVINCN